MKKETIELTFWGKVVQVVGCLAPLFLIIVAFELTKNAPEWVKTLGMVIAFGYVFLQVFFEQSGRYKSWLEHHFGRKVITEVPDPVPRHRIRHRYRSNNDDDDDDTEDDEKDAVAEEEILESIAVVGVLENMDRD